MRKVKLIIIGFGVIGKGVVRVISMKQKYIRQTYDIDLKISAICEVNGSIISEKGIDPKYVLELADNKKLNEHPDWNSMTCVDVLKNVDADIALELTPGNIKTGEPGLIHITEALKNKKHVVTSNKAPLALKFTELQKLADENNRKLRYEATVGGAIPIFNLCKETLQVNKVNSIHGILNGTTNFILTKMTQDGISLDIALKEAQELGIAEKDPSYDIKGYDTAVKVAILANALLNKDIGFEDVCVTGIEEITSEAIELAKKQGCVIKLIGDANNLEVSPRLIPISHPLNVDGTLNAVMIHTDIAGDITLVGKGAGATETSSSILSDILDIALK